jgi:Leucine-rich repeat (LRR) protein
MQRQILKLTSLEILDLCHNRLTSIPIEIVNLTSLKVLSIYKNTIKELPLCLGNLKSLQVLKFSGSQLVLPPPDV